MSVQKFLGTIETDGVKDERGIETPSLSATGEVSGKTGVFSESVTAPVLNGKATSAGSADSATNATNATNDGEGNNIANTYATKEALAEETSAREAADETLSKGITAEATARAEELSALQTGLTGGTITVAEATHAASADSATNATNATNATKATQDGDGNVITSTYARQSGTYSGLTAGDLVLSGTSMNPTLSNGIINIDIPSTTGIYLVTVYCTFTVSSQSSAYVCYGSALLNVQIFGVGMTFLPVYDADGFVVGFLGLSGYLKTKSPGLAFYNLSLQKQTISAVSLSAVTQQALATE